MLFIYIEMHAKKFKRDIVGFNEIVKSEKQQHSTINRTGSRFIQQGAKECQISQRDCLFKLMRRKKHQKTSFFFQYSMYLTTNLHKTVSIWLSLLRARCMVSIFFSNCCGESQPKVFVLINWKLFTSFRVYQKNIHVISVQKAVLRLTSIQRQG